MHKKYQYFLLCMLIPSVMTFTMWLCITQTNKIYGFDNPGKVKIDTCPDIGYTSSVTRQRENILKNRAVDTSRLPIGTIDVSKILSEDPNMSDSDFIEVTGYFVKYKFYKPESCNCYNEDPATFDVHLFLAATPDEHSISRTMICEITRKAPITLRVQNFFGYEGHRVAIWGWVFHDRDHENAKWRGTPVEIHPVTHLEIID